MVFAKMVLAKHTMQILRFMPKFDLFNSNSDLSLSFSLTYIYIYINPETVNTIISG